MFQLDLKSKKSIYEQVVEGFKKTIISGELKAGERLPSVRELSSKLTVNPNTIQKAYSALELQGWIYTVSGRGCYVSEGSHEADEKQVTGIYEQIDSLLSELIYHGISAEDIIYKIGMMIRDRRGDND